jgi:hypothetical protein|tara:strand:+ start:544 stop:801 length:258 start_codon:yes stop_codon:yes gene_type:complete
MNNASWKTALSTVAVASQAPRFEGVYRGTFESRPAWKGPVAVDMASPAPRFGGVYLGTFGLTLMSTVGGIIVGYGAGGLVDVLSR